MKKIFVLFMGLMLLASCATVGPPQPGILGDYYKKLEPGPEGAAELRWLKPGVDFSKYNKVKLDPVSFAPADSQAAEMKDIDPEKLKELADKCNQALANAINKKYPVVTEPGPDVVEVRFAMIDLKKSYPVFSGVTSILPIGLAINLLKRPVTGRWTGGGSTIAQLMAKDSATGDVIAVAQDNYEAGFWERFSSYGQAEDAFEFWGEKLVKFLDEAHGAKK
jgi:hypothetical protein